jgi:hypothetical protein
MNEKETIKALKIIYAFLDYVLNFLAYETTSQGTGRLANMLTELNEIINKLGSNHE